MQPAFRLLLTTATVGALAVSARADARDEVAQAVKAQNEAPAYRMFVVTTDHVTKTVNTLSLETVKPDSLHMKQEADGKTQVEVLSDGKRTLMSQNGGALEEAPAGLAAMIATARRSAAMEDMVKTAQNVQVAGHETISGTPATIYTFDSDVLGLQTTNKLWVSDKDHLPLKSEGTVKGDLQMGGQTAQKMDRGLVTTYQYDPSIKIVLPPAK